MRRTQAPDAARVDIRLVDLDKRFGDVAAVDGVDLDIARGEFFTMLGPSGSGKTTTLRLIAGFELPDAGRVELARRPTSRGRPPFERDVNTVFQDYALFPHMTVLRERRVRPAGSRRSPRAERRTRAEEALEHGAPATTSARASRRSSPAASASASRWPGRSSTARRCCCSTSRSARSTSSCARRCRSSSSAIQREVGITFVFVTHDQEEALTMSDRIAVFNAGRIEQVGTPAEVYEHPANEFVAGFVGVSNVARARRAAVHDPARRRSASLGEGEAADGPARRGAAPSRDVVYVGRPPAIVVDLDAGGALLVVRQNLETSS